MWQPLLTLDRSLLASPSPVVRHSWRWAPLLGWAALIYYLSSQSNLPGFDVSIADFIFKKCAHMFVYGVLFFLFHRAVNWQQPLQRQNFWLPLLLTLIFAASDELHQHFTPHRTATPRDIGYDMLGAAIVWLKMYRYI